MGCESVLTGSDFPSPKVLDVSPVDAGRTTQGGETYATGTNTVILRLLGYPLPSRWTFDVRRVHRNTWSPLGRGQSRLGEQSRTHVQL